MTCVGQSGHFGPLRPLVTALLEQGDRVLVASGSEIESAVVESGAAFAAAGSGLGSWFGRLAGRIRGAPGDGLAPARIGAYFVPRLFAEIGAADMIDDVVRLGREFGAEAVLFDTEAFCGPLAAEVLGLPSVHHAFGALPDAEVQQLATDALSPLWRSFGRDVPPGAGLHRGPTVAVFPPRIDPWSHLFRDQIRSVRTVAPLTGSARPTRPPQVYVTFGTQWGNADLFREVIAALAGEALQLMITTGGIDPSDLGELPPNVTAVRYRPQEDILPSCSAVIHHAGAGTMLGALAHGLPQLTMPQAADNFVNADLLAGSGAAEVLLPDQVGADTIRTTLRAVLYEPRYRTAAVTIADELASMPTPQATASLLRADVSDQTH